MTEIVDDFLESVKGEELGVNEFIVEAGDGFGFRHGVSHLRRV